MRRVGSQAFPPDHCIILETPMSKRRLGRTELSIDPLVFGCNVLGWTLEESAAHGVLDAFVGEGLTAFDTADSYGKGKSETILGNWIKARGNRDKVLVFT